VKYNRETCGDGAGRKIWGYIIWLILRNFGAVFIIGKCEATLLHGFAEKVINLIVSESLNIIDIRNDHCSRF
jgi:hypothetical protein